MLKLSTSLANIAVECLLLSAFLFSGMSRGTADLLASLTGNFYTELILYVTLLQLAMSALVFPLKFYSGFYIEHQFSFSNQNVRSWIIDELKEALLTYLVSLSVILVFYMIARNAGAMWWLICAGVWIILSALLANIFPVLILPLFYKGRRLEDGSLKEKILLLGKKMNIKLLDVFEIDMSRTTRKSNAALVGWGNTRRVILADNLLKEFSEDEIMAVVAHEMAHYKMGHIWMHLIAGAVSIVIFFAVIGYLLPSWGRIGAEGVYDISIFPAILLLFIVYELAAMPFHNTLSRRLEKDADIAALKALGARESFISMMKKLSEKNLSDDEPNRMIEIVFYSHPSISKRISLARNFTF